MVYNFRLSSDFTISVSMKSGSNVPVQMIPELYQLPFSVISCRLVGDAVGFTDFKFTLLASFWIAIAIPT